MPNINVTCDGREWVVRLSRYTLVAISTLISLSNQNTPQKPSIYPWKYEWLIIYSLNRQAGISSIRPARI